MQLQDWYNATVVPLAANAAVSPPQVNGASVNAAGSLTQSASGSFSASGHPAAWFLIVVAAVLVLYHLD